MHRKASSSAIAELSLGENLGTIGRSAFEDCNALTAVDLPDKVRAVRARAFRDCDALTSFNIGTSFAEHDDNFVAYCYNLTILTTNSGNGAGFIAVDNVLLHNVRQNKSYVIACAPGKTGDYAIPVERLEKSEVHIFDNAFAGCESLTSITFPAGKTYTMGKAVFDGCYELRYIDLRGTGTWDVSCNDPDNSFYELPDLAIIWADASTTYNQDEENVVAGNWAEYLHLTDEWDFTPKVEFTAGAVEMERELFADFNFNFSEENDEPTTEANFIPAGFTTYLPYPLTLDAENVRVYEPSAITTEQQTDDTTGETVDVTVVTFVEVESGQMKAYTPYYFVVESDGVDLDNDEVVTITLNPQTTAWNNAGYTFTGTTVTIPNSELAAQQAYILQPDNVWLRVSAVRGAEQAYVGPFRAYFHALPENTNPASKLMTRLSEGGDDIVTEVTVIRTVDANGDSRYFDINGRLLPGKPESGFYIHGGKKFIAK